MLVTNLLIMITVMANSTHDTAMGFPETRDCLGTGHLALVPILALLKTMNVKDGLTLEQMNEQQTSWGKAVLSSGLARLVNFIKLVKSIIM